MKKNTAKTVSLDALAIALVCLSTMLIQIPIPFGYMHLGNCFILLLSVFFGPMTGLRASGIGSALADLFTGYTAWILPTLLIKGFMGFCIGALASHKKGIIQMKSFRTFLASMIGILIMIVGYFIAGSFLYGSIAAGATQIPGLFLEGAIGMVLFYITGTVFERANIVQLINHLH